MNKLLKYRYNFFKPNNYLKSNKQKYSNFFFIKIPSSSNNFIADFTYLSAKILLYNDTRRIISSNTIINSGFYIFT